MNESAPFHERVAATSLTPSENRVADFIAQNPSIAAAAPTAELGSLSSTSDATVVRLAKKLGYSGFRELRKAVLATSSRHRDPSKVLDDQLGQLGASVTQARIVFRETEDALSQLDSEFDQGSWDQAIELISKGARTIAFGIGPSGCVADYLSFSLNRSGTLSFGVTHTGFRLADDLLHIGQDDVVVLFATLRQFTEVDVVLSHARRVGAKTILISETLGQALRERVDVVLATPPTTNGTSDGAILGMVVAHALSLSVASLDRSSAVESVNRLNELRSQIVHDGLDVEESVRKIAMHPRRAPTMESEIEDGNPTR